MSSHVDELAEMFTDDGSDLNETLKRPFTAAEITH